jgi:hypothetical protein
MAKGRKTQVRRNNNQQLYRAPFYRAPSVMMPESWDTTLKYAVLNTVTNAAGFVASVRFGTNAYDVDPALGSTAMAGFAEFAAFYKKFRTLKLSYKFSVSNSEAFPMTIIHGFSTTVVASGSLGIGYSTNPLFTTSQIGSTDGADTTTVKGNATVARIYGTEQVLYDDLFTGSTTSSTLPTASTAWCYLGILSAFPLTAVGVQVTSLITLNVRFFSRNFLLV